MSDPLADATQRCDPVEPAAAHHEEVGSCFRDSGGQRLNRWAVIDLGSWSDSADRLEVELLAATRADEGERRAETLPEYPGDDRRLGRAGGPVYPDADVARKHM